MSTLLIQVYTALSEYVRDKKVTKTGSRTRTELDHRIKEMTMAHVNVLLPQLKVGLVREIDSV